MIVATDQECLNNFKRQHVDVMSRFEWNCHIKLARNFTPKTSRTICDICLWLLVNNLVFATEVKTVHSKKRADIVVPELYGSEVIEVYDSEGLESIEAKKEVYDKAGISFLAVPADTNEAIRLIKEANGW